MYKRPDQVPFCDNTARLGYSRPEHAFCITPNMLVSRHLTHRLLNEELIDDLFFFGNAILDFILIVANPKDLVQSQREDCTSPRLTQRLNLLSTFDISPTQMIMTQSVW